MSKKKKKNYSNNQLHKENALIPLEVTESAQKIAITNNIPGVYMAAKNEPQKKAIQTIIDNQISFLYGIPGSGKSFLAMAVGLQEVLKGKYKRLILTRPYVESGEHLGFLPGNFNSKIAPFMFPLMEMANSLFKNNETTLKFIESGIISVMPIAYLRGTTFSESFIVADEMQNSTITQMRLVLTRMGENSKMVITGDNDQSDLSKRYDPINGLQDAVNRLKNIPNVGFCELGYDACVRSKIVSDIDSKYRITKKK